MFGLSCCVVFDFDDDSGCVELLELECFAGCEDAVWMMDCVGCAVADEMDLVVVSVLVLVLLRRPGEGRFAPS